jgi:hypothetical protein
MNDNFDLESIKELQQLAQLKDEEIDTSDIPERTRPAETLNAHQSRVRP